MNLREVRSKELEKKDTDLMFKVDKGIEELNQLNFIKKVASTIKSLNDYIKPNHLNKNFKCTVELLYTFPQSWGLVYDIEGAKGKVKFNEEDLSLLSKCFHSIKDNKLLSLACTGIHIEDDFSQQLIKMLLGEKILNKYFQEEVEMVEETATA